MCSDVFLCWERYLGSGVMIGHPRDVGVCTLQFFVNAHEHSSTAKHNGIVKDQPITPRLQFRSRIQCLVNPGSRK